MGNGPVGEEAVGDLATVTTGFGLGYNLELSQSSELKGFAVVS